MLRRSSGTTVRAIARRAIAPLTMFSTAAVAQSTPPVFAPPGRVTRPPADYGTYEPPSIVTIRGTTTDQERPPSARIEFPENGPCRWLPWKPSRDYGAGAARRTAEEEAGQARAFASLVRILQATPIAKPPVGFCPHIAILAYTATPDLGHALRTVSTLMSWPATDLYRRADGQLAYDGEVGGMIIDINRPNIDTWSTLVDPTMRDSLGRFFQEVPIIGTFQGFPVYLGDRLVVSRQDVPLQRPVAMERVVRWVLREDSTLLARLPPGNSEATRQKKIESIARLRAQLAALDANERAAPGCLATNGYGLIMAVVRSDDPTCRKRIFERNPDIYDRSLPRWAPQVITVHAVIPFEKGPPADRRPSQREIDRWSAMQLVWGIDWQQVRREYLGAPSSSTTERRE
jgi:hypothetical protein